MTLMTSVSPVGRASGITGIVLICALIAAPAVAQQRSEKYEGRRLDDALGALQAKGLRIVFSTEVVTAEMRVVAEPRATAAREVLEELLAPHRLEVREGPGGVLQVVRARRATDRPGAADLTSGALDGQVVDAATGLPLVGVLVEIAGTQRATRTDGQGRFQLRELRAGAHMLEVGIRDARVRRTIRITGGKTLSVTVALPQVASGYSELLTVAAPPFEQREPGVGAEMRLGIDQLQGLRGVLADDPMRIVQSFPRVAAADDFRSEFSVRGSPYRHIGVVIDGVATPWLQHSAPARGDAGTLAMLSGDVLGEAKLQTGGYPLQDGNWLGATLGLTLREGSRSAARLRGAIGGAQATIVGEGPLGHARRGSWLVAIRNSFMDWPNRPDGESIRTVFAFTDLQSKVVYDAAPGQQVSVSLLAGQSGIDEGDDRAPHELADGTNRTGVLNVGWRSMFGSGAVLSQRAYVVAHRFRNETQAGQDAGEGEDGELAYRADVVSRVFGGVVEAGGHVQRIRASRDAAAVPAMLAEELPAHPSFSQFAAASWLRAGYAHFRWTPLFGVTVAPGLRVTDATHAGGPTIARWVLGEWRVRPNWTVNASTGVSRQLPELELMLGATGASDLRAERATHVDFGLEQRVSPSIRWQATLFTRRERDVLRPPDSAPRLVDGALLETSDHARYENALRGASRGIELLLERRSATGLSGWVAYSFGRTRYADLARGETFWADFDQRHAVNASSVLRISDRSSVALQFRAGTNFPLPGYLSGRDGRLFVGERRNDVRLPVYARLDVRARRTLTFGSRRLTLFAELLNALNRTNLRPSSGFIRRDTHEAVGFTERLFQRLPSAGLLIEF